MKNLNVSFTVKKIKQKIDRNDIVFNHPIQRKSDQWTEEQRSLLIHSIAMGYPIPPLYAIKDKEENNKYSVLDGKQRSTNIGSFMDDEWALSNDTPEVIIDGIEYEIAGLKFSELPEEVKQELEDASLLMYIFEDCSEEEIEEIFYRLNNGTALTKDQKTRAKLGSDLAKYIDEVLELDFFKHKASFTKCQLRRAEDQTCILQTLMLITDYKFSKFENNDITKFTIKFRDTYKQEDLELCKSLFCKLNMAFDYKHKLIKKINIPMFIMALKSSEELDIPFIKFKEWINDFVDNYDTNSEYSECCRTHTTNKDRVYRRLELINNSLIDYVS